MGPVGPHELGSGGTEAGIYPGGADDFSQVDVHPVVTTDQVPVVRLTILQLHQLLTQ